MWEDASPPLPPKQRRIPKKGNGQLLKVQILLCIIIVGFIASARQFRLPCFVRLRQNFNAIMQPEYEYFLGDERHFVVFTEQAVKSAVHAAEQTVQRLHRNSQPPVGAKEESYLPDYTLRFPLPWRGYAETSGYGWRTDPMGGQGTDFHTGNDIAAAEGTAVLAAADGTVRTAGWHKSYGNYARILHKGGDETLYAHMQYLFVHTGAQVHAGQQLGTVGATGNATGPHLHFELLHKGFRYDPCDALHHAS